MFKQSGVRLARYLNRRVVRSGEKGRKKKVGGGVAAAVESDSIFDVEKLLRTLPKLPLNQQKVVRSLLNSQGREKVDALLKEKARWIETKDGEEEVEKASGGRKDLRNKLLYDKETSLETLQQYFPMVAERPNLFDKLFWKCVFQYHKIIKVQGNAESSSPPYGFFVELFELAKLQPDGRIRYACVKLAGDILYSYNTVRMDPFNEVEYMDSLCYFGNSFKAIGLWKSRRTKKDVEDSIYWLEVGILYYQQAKHLSTAEKLACEMETEFGYIQPRVIIGFIQAYASSGQVESIDKWVSKFISIIEMNNCKLLDEQDTIDNLIDSKDAQSLFNTIKPPSTNDLQKVTSILLTNNLWSQSAVVIEYLEKCGVNDSVKQMLQVFDSTARRLVHEVQTNASGSLVPRKYRRSKKAAIPENNKQLMVVISKIISVYPEVLENPKFYESWLRGLTGLELYDNAIMVVEAMVERGITPTTDHIIALIRSLLAKNELRLALDLLSKLESSPDVYPPRTQSIYGLFLSHGARRSDHEFVNNIIERMYAQGLQHSPPTFNTLLFYYYRHKDFESIFKLFAMVKSSDDFELSHMNYRTMWRIMRDYYYLSSHDNLPGKDSASTPPPNLRALFSEMVKSRHFRLSMNVFENAVHAMMLSGDYEAAAAVLCYMDTVTNIRIPSILVVSVLQLATKIVHKTSFAFPNTVKGELIVQPGYSSEASVEWELVVHKLCEILLIDNRATISKAKEIINAISDDKLLVR